MLLLGTYATAAAELVPASTAYVAPEPDGARVTERGISGWGDPGEKVIWFGEFTRTGVVSCQVEFSLGDGGETQVMLQVGDQTKTAVAATNNAGGYCANFGTFQIPTTGYHSFELLLQPGTTSPSTLVKSLILEGEAVDQAHFNLKPRRNAASVHLAYPVPDGARIEAFYCEVTAIEEPTSTFYMACGWHRGYFGMQVNSPTERRIIFSVWDSGGEAVDRKKVADDNRVRLMGRGQDVYTGDFGNEGTGGHSHLKFMWKTGQKQRFLVTAIPTNETFTIYSGFYFHPEKDEWMLISSWKAPKEGGYLRGLNSFSENFWGSNGHIRRKALYGNQWIRTVDGAWAELTVATFSHDATGRSDRRDRFMGVEANQFFLSHGGFVPGHTRFGEKFERKPTGKSPGLLKLPPITIKP